MDITMIDQNLRALHEQLSKGAITVDAKVIIPGWVFIFEPLANVWVYSNNEGDITGHADTLESAMSIALMPLVE